MICANCGRNWPISEYQYGQNVCNYCWSNKAKIRETERNRSRRASLEIQREYPQHPQPLRQYPSQLQNDGGCCGCIFAIVFLIVSGWLVMHLFEWLVRML
jgi:hypothetical protein